MPRVAKTAIAESQACISWRNQGMTDPGNIADMCASRVVTHGRLVDAAVTDQALKDVLRGAPNWRRLLPHQKEALEMIVSKMGRILHGDWTFADHWRDIAGYAGIVADDCDEEDRRVK